LQRTDDFASTFMAEMRGLSLQESRAILKVLFKQQVEIPKIDFFIALSGW
jgi:hypothetical protein